LNSRIRSPSRAASGLPVNGRAWSILLISSR
jgi:hypothetical protein